MPDGLNRHSNPMNLVDIARSDGLLRRCPAQIRKTVALECAEFASKVPGPENHEACPHSNSCENRVGVFR